MDPLERLRKAGLYFDKDEDGKGDPPPDDKKKKDGDGDDKSVPYDRFREVNEAKAKAEAEAQKAKDDLAKLTKQIEDEKNESLSEIEKLVKAQEDLSGKFEAEQLKNRRLEVAGKYNIPAGMVGRLQGSTVEELEADAKALVEFIKIEDKGKSPPPPGGEGSGDDAVDVSKMSPAEVRKSYDEGKYLTRN